MVNSLAQDSPFANIYTRKFSGNVEVYVIRMYMPVNSLQLVYTGCCSLSGIDLSPVKLIHLF